MTKGELLARFKIILEHFGIPYSGALELRERYVALEAQEDWNILVPSFLDKLEARLRSAAPKLLDDISVDMLAIK